MASDINETNELIVALWEQLRHYEENPESTKTFEAQNKYELRGLQHAVLVILSRDRINQLPEAQRKHWEDRMST